MTSKMASRCCLSASVSCRTLDLSSDTVMGLALGYATLLIAIDQALECRIDVLVRESVLDVKIEVYQDSESGSAISKGRVRSLSFSVYAPGE